MRNPHHRSARDRGLVLNAHPHIVLTQHAGAERDEFLALMLIGVHGDRDVYLVRTISVTPDEEVIGARPLGRPRRIGGKWRAVTAGDFGQVDMSGPRKRS